MQTLVSAIVVALVAWIVAMQFVPISPVPDGVDAREVRMLVGNVSQEHLERCLRTFQRFRNAHQQRNLREMRDAARVAMGILGEVVMRAPNDTELVQSLRAMTSHVDDALNDSMAQIRAETPHVRMLYARPGALPWKTWNEDDPTNSLTPFP